MVWGIRYENVKSNILMVMKISTKSMETHNVLAQYK